MRRRPGVEVPGKDYRPGAKDCHHCLDVRHQTAHVSERRAIVAVERNALHGTAALGDGRLLPDKPAEFRHWALHAAHVGRSTTAVVDRCPVAHPRRVVRVAELGRVLAREADFLGWHHVRRVLRNQRARQARFFLEVLHQDGKAALALALAAADEVAQGQGRPLAPEPLQRQAAAVRTRFHNLPGRLGCCVHQPPWSLVTHACHTIPIEQ
mmetsp:Transcript_45047/g.116690  ORF Transcript_45047/g.116690 Transcript_45047/m.116690 type:complete len:210 (-) Transcript_45047:150-779(-)